MRMAKPTVAVFFGSRSTEHDVSIITAIASVIKPLQLSQKFDVLPVYIAKDGRWYSDVQLGDINLYNSGKLDSFLKTQRPLGLLFSNGLKLIKSKGLKRQIVSVDVAFPALHGTHGEDGEIMGIFEMADVPYVGCDVESSAIAMDKIVTKQVARGAGLATVKDVVFTKSEYAKLQKVLIAQVEKELGYPSFVKPPHLGSSIGVTKVNNRTELENAIEVALVYDWRVLIEQAVPNLREATLPIMGNGADLMPAYLEEPLFSSEEFFDFDTKYMSGSKKMGGKKGGGKQGAQGYSKIPADFKKSIYDEAEKTALAAYQAVGCGGTARVDILIDYKKEKVYFNEINPLPGSLYAHNWQRKGISNVELVERLIKLAQERAAAKKQLETAFSSSFLEQF
jgi:D-alanine-D-alanine ligase